MGSQVCYPKTTTRGITTYKTCPEGWIPVKDRFGTVLYYVEPPPSAGSSLTPLPTTTVTATTDAAKLAAQKAAEAAAAAAAQSAAAYQQTASKPSSTSTSTTTNPTAPPGSQEVEMPITEAASATGLSRTTLIVGGVVVVGALYLIFRKR